MCEETMYKINDRFVKIREDNTRDRRVILDLYDEKGDFADAFTIYDNSASIESQIIRRFPGDMTPAVSALIAYITHILTPAEHDAIHDTYDTLTKYRADSRLLQEVGLNSHTCLEDDYDEDEDRT